MKISVLGAGAGGTAVAFDCAAHGHDVRIFDFPAFPQNIAAIAGQKGIHASGDLAGFAAIASAGHGIGAQPQLDHRYLNEDVGYGLVFMARLAHQIGVATPTMDAMIHMTSVLMDRDYAGEAIRTPTTLGIGDLSAEALGSL